MRKEKVGIISIHYGVNFGSSLQAIALSQYLKKNFEFERVDVINYIPKKIQKDKPTEEHIRSWSKIFYARLD